MIFISKNIFEITGIEVTAIATATTSLREIMLFLGPISLDKSKNEAGSTSK